MSSDRLDDLLSAVRIMQKRAALSKSWAAGCFGQWDWRLREKWLKKAAIRERSVKRLCVAVIKECDRIKEIYARI